MCIGVPQSVKSISSSGTAPEIQSLNIGGTIIRTLTTCSAKRECYAGLSRNMLDNEKIASSQTVRAGHPEYPIGTAGSTCESVPYPLGTSTRHLHMLVGLTQGTGSR